MTATFSANLVNWFQLRFPQYAKAMKECSHHFDEKNLNPYHIEDSVWTHTLMALNIAEMMNMSGDLKVALLLHDIGKPYAKQIMDDEAKKKCKFTGHAAASFWRAGEVLEKLMTDAGMSMKSVRDILFIIANHGLLFDNDLEMGDKWREKLKEMNIYNSNLIDFAYCDANGRLNIHPQGNFLNYEKYKELKQNCDNSYVRTEANITDDRPVLTLLMGLPASGKSTYIKYREDLHNCDTFILSRDSLMLQMAGTKDYDLAWKTVDHDAVNAELDRQFMTYIKARKNVVIDMTNMSKKSRKKWLNRAEGYRKEGIIIYSTLDTIYKRILERVEDQNKVIPSKVVNQMMLSFTFPLLDEFDYIDWIPCDEKILDHVKIKEYKEIII